MKVSFNNGGSAELLDKFQKQNKVFLPNEYYKFLIRTNGVVFPENTMFRVETLGEEITLDSLFGILPEKKWIDLNYENREYRNELPEGGVVIGRDMLGGHVIMLIDGDSRGVYYWDDALNFSKSTEDSNAYLIAKTFEDFSDMLGGFEEAETDGDEQESVLPLGSVVVLRGGIQKLIIISRAINVKNNEKTFFFDYGAVLYPDGLVNDKMAYFNHKDIDTVLFEGCRDSDNDIVVKNIREYRKNNPSLTYGDAQSWNS